MASTMATPAKAKAFLASIKETAVDNEKDASLELLFLSFLRLEIFQRGILTDDGQQPPDPAAKILEALQSVAGKSLVSVESATLPKPLMAGSLGMQGKIAELMVQRVADAGSDSASKELRQGSFKKQAVAPVIQRCQDVDDNRLLALMKMWDEENSVDFVVNLLTLAEGAHYRAASFQPDAPSMWKRAWETHSERHRQEGQQQTHWESHGSIPALESLCRIMNAKGNEKRAAELSVRLASAWLDATRLSLTKATSKSTSLNQKIEEAFVDPFRSLPTRTPSKAIAQSQKCLSAVTSPENLSSEDLFLFSILSLDVSHMRNQVGLYEALETVEKQAKNRSENLKASQLDQKARESFFLSRIEEDLRNEFELFEKVLEKCLSGTQPESLRFAAFDALTHFVIDQREAAFAVQHSSGKADSIVQQLWMQVGRLSVVSFSKYCAVSSIEEIEKRLVSSSLSERQFLEEISRLVCQVSWMTLAFHIDRPETLPFSVSDYKLAQVISRYFCDEKSKEAAIAKTAAVSSKSQSEEILYVRLRLDFLAAKYWTLLHQDALTSSDILEITNESLSLMSFGDLVQELDADHGVTVLGCLLSWSGFFQAAWEFCIVPESRNLIQKARNVLQQSQKVYKRPAHKSEQILLDLAEADAEVAGLKSKAMNLYESLLGSNFARDEDASVALFRAKCHLGIARLAPNNEFATESAEASLKILRALVPSQAPLCIWKSSDSQQQAVRSQIVLCRQVIAENLIQLNRLQEAGEFLHDAVKEAPSDQVASFALGSFLLRMVFFHGQSSTEAQKSAQTQLLKAAKLDSTKAGPFALLGYWYESKQDIKRAIGCYSKALILESAHPVAGRGIIRLGDRSTIDMILKRAIESPSSLNGWAWLFVGKVKANIEGKDELAVSALLKATRARDIEDPFSDPLAVFYSGPTRPMNPNQEDLVEGLLLLSGCYKRLGRCSAEVRTLHNALKASGDNVSWSLLHACGLGKSSTVLCVFLYRFLFFSNPS